MNKNILILFALSIHFILNGQSVNYETSTLPFPIESVNVYTDRDLYLSGETIWFSANIYLDNGQESLSKILFIELFNANQKSIIKRKYKITNGFAKGALDIPIEFLSNVYYLRAYTTYNKNFAVEKYFVSAIQIINPKKGIPAKTENNDLNTTNNYSINNYSIVPAKARKGMQIVSIFKSQKTDNVSRETLSLELLDNCQEILSEAEFSLTSPSAFIAFPDSAFTKPGLYYYLLKNKQKEIIKIRAFIYRGLTKVSSKFELQKNEFNQRDSVNIELNKFAPSNYSQLGIKTVLKGSILSQYDKLKLFMNDPYLLISFIKTQFNPLIFNSKEINSILTILNLKLNTEEYKNCFYTNDVFELKWKLRIKNTDLSGFVVDKSSHKPLSNIPVYLSVFGDRPQIYITTSRSNGSFQFSITNYDGTKDILLCPLYKNTDEIELEIDEEFTTVFPDFKSIALTLDSSHLSLLEKMLIASQFSKSQKTRSKQQDFSIENLPFSFDDPEISVVLDNYIATPTLKMVFKELVPTIRLRKRNNSYKLSVVDIENNILYNNPLVLVDEVPIFNIEELLTIPPSEINKIEIHYTPFTMGDYTLNGIVTISTFTDNLGGIKIPKSAIFSELQTISPAYNFKAKNYTSSEELKSRSADFRTLLHWDPFIQKNSSNKLQFYTSDQTGTYETYIFGIYKNGQAFHLKLFDFEVKD